ncbi:cytochrome b-c1 complex subunit Rieske-4, mitochondrial-like [Olea europaea subsp. europaea]|uniref:Cytochrome b-c1 complex subunit Rieske-4, mitochondrial-like n=1 Tax=Olea europaea subsp. europaea TaxID=158383 RepID=A0A8S0SQF8_OLEEU|nr:cytochrome b-c1 complex subunit Rieske-4, mitochondrial-like [Olea europaea subsp. europaea]
MVVPHQSLHPFSIKSEVFFLAPLHQDMRRANQEPEFKDFFIRHRTEADIKLANSVDVASSRDPQDDSVRLRILNGLWLLGCAPIWGASRCQILVTSVVGFALAMGHITTYPVGFAKGLHL